MQTHQTDFSKGNVYRNIIEVSLPMTLAVLHFVPWNGEEAMKKKQKC